MATFGGPIIAACMRTGMANGTRLGQRTMISGKATPSPLDRVSRQFSADQPSQL